jgi:hypothetical protein
MNAFLRLNTLSAKSMCPYDASRIALLSDQLIPDLARMVVEYDACPEELTHEWRVWANGASFTSKCACFHGERDRVYEFVRKDYSSTVTVIFDRTGRPIRESFDNRGTVVSSSLHAESALDMNAESDSTVFVFSYRTARGYNAEEHATGTLADRAAVRAILEATERAL